MEPTPTHIPLKVTLSERAAAEQVSQQHATVAQLGYLSRAFDAVPNAVAILNRQRQVVYANPAFCSYVDAAGMEEIVGARIGEALTCVHSDLEEGGCGTSDYCTTCGALHAMLQAQQGKRSVKECRITRRRGGELEAVDLRVWATPFEVESQPFTIFAATDIADEKRRAVLERIFFHDIRNTAGVIFGVAELMRAGMPDTAELNFHDLLLHASQKLLDEINAQQQLLAAERGELVVTLAPLLTRDLLQQVVSMYAQHDVGRQRHVQINPTADQLLIQSDETLLGRVLGNMLKNALEACAAGDTVTASCKQVGETVQFAVHNPTVMPQNVQLQVFRRSFSTKGGNRGLGTYSIKLLTEQYLHGTVSFVSTAETGTIFTAVFPITPA